MLTTMTTTVMVSQMLLMHSLTTTTSGMIQMEMELETMQILMMTVTAH